MSHEKHHYLIPKNKVTVLFSLEIYSKTDISLFFTFKKVSVTEYP